MIRSIAGLILAVSAALGAALGATFIAVRAHAQTAVHEAIWDTHQKRWLTPTELASLGQTGDIFIMGEDHATLDNQNDPETHIHHDNQVRFIKALQSQAAKMDQTSVSVGMEFLTYTFQSAVDQYLAGLLPEDRFLKAVEWSSNPFEFYRRQILAPRQSHGQTVALNIPESIAHQVAIGGPASLTADQRALLPPLWERGNPAYFERFQEVMQGHASVTEIENFFWAQSLWDDTMAWKASQYRSLHPRDMMVVIIGAFHVEYGGGFPFELKRYTSAPVKTILQIQAKDWDPKTLQSLIQPDPKYGATADYLWLHSGFEPPRTASIFNRDLRLPEPSG